MPDVTLPALDGSDPLGFLAALGTLEVVARHLDAGACLSWDPWRQAVLSSRFACCSDLAAGLQSVVATMPPGALLPGVPVGFPRPSGAKGGDPLRCPRSEWRALRATTLECFGPEAARWLEHLTTDLAVDSKDRAALTPWLAPSGQQSVGSALTTCLAFVRKREGWLLEALEGWVRQPGYSGEYLDVRALNSAAEDPKGRSSEMGVPGATWLALMALSLLRLGGDGVHVGGTLWHRDGGHLTARWSLWRMPINRTGVDALLATPRMLAVPGTMGGYSAGRVPVPGKQGGSGVLAALRPVM